MKKKSFIRCIFTFLMILMGLLIFILCIFLSSSFEILEKEMKDSSDTLLKIYSNELNNSIKTMDNFLKTIAGQSVELARLNSNDENERILASISLHNFMKDTIATSKQVDAIIVYDEKYEICLDAISSNVKYKEKMEMRKHSIHLMEDKMSQNTIWSFVTINGITYIYKPIKFNGRILSIYMQMSNLLKVLEKEENGKRCILITDYAGRIGGVWGMEDEDIQTSSFITQINQDNYYHTNKEISNGQLYIYSYTSKDAILQQIHSSMIIIGIIVVVAVMFLFFIVHYTKKSIIHPMRVTIDVMKCIKQGEYSKRIVDEFHTKEFELLQTTTNQMVDEIVGLKIQTYEKMIQLQDMQLRIIRLQLKPHFFLNALTTISSLSGQNQNTQIITYIDALSRNVRYMFRTGFHTVSIKEEIRHVKNYFEMQELKYPNCVFYFIDMPEEVSEWRIPQMLIHTFIENEYKYAVEMNETLTILIKVNKQNYKEEEMLLIEIEDDGRGYPEEVIGYMNGAIRKPSDSANRIGLWSVKQMLELMYEEEDLMIIENIEPHGCLNRIYIPEKPIHELLEDKI